MTTLIVGCGYLGERLAADWSPMASRSTAPSAPRLRGGARPARDRAGHRRCAPARDAGRAARGRSGLLRGRVRPLGGAAMRDVYVVGLQNVLDRLPSSVRRFVYASSTGVYGQTGGEWVDEEADRAAARIGPSRVGGRRARRRMGGSGQALGGHPRFAGLYGPGRIVPGDARAGRADPRRSGEVPESRPR